MLAPANRLTAPSAFAAAVRRGHRAGTTTLVVHLHPDASADRAHGEPRVGFVVSKQVGQAVVRNRVKRRLRHLVRERVPTLPGTSVLVVRALPSAAGASYAELGDDLDRALTRVLKRWSNEEGR